MYWRAKHFKQPQGENIDTDIVGTIKFVVAHKRRRHINIKKNIPMWSPAHFLDGYRLKENVSYDFDATSRLKQLKPYRFNFKFIGLLLTLMLGLIISLLVTNSKEQIGCSLRIALGVGNQACINLG